MMERDIHGGDIKHFLTKKDNVLECRNACMKDKKCKAFTYQKKARNCWLKDDTHNPNSENRNLISGFKRCYYGELE